MSKRKGGPPMPPPSERLLAQRDGLAPAVEGDGVTPRSRVLALNRRMAGATGPARAALDKEMDAALDDAPEFAAAMEPHALAAGLTIQNFGAIQPMMAIATARKMREVRVGLGYDAAPTLERLLIEQIALCWLRQGEAELMYSQIMKGEHKPAQSAYAERRLSACMSRYVRAVEALARVRRLSKGVAVQVNVANQQIVAG